MVWVRLRNYLTAPENRVPIVVFLFFVCLIVRLIGLPGKTLASPNGDDGRDLLVASHILRYGELPVAGPFAAGGRAILRNSPVYYYLIAAFSAAGMGTAVGTYMVWAAVTSLTACFTYLAIRNLTRDGVLPFLGALTVALHPVLVETSQNITQPYALPVITSWIVYTVTKPRPSLTDMAAMIVAVSLGLHLHMSMILLVPVAAAWLVFAARSHNLWTRNRQRILFFLTGLVWVNVLLWLFLTFDLSMKEFVNFLRAGGVTVRGSLIAHLHLIGREWVGLFLSVYHWRAGRIFFLAVAVSLWYMARRAFRVRDVPRIPFFWLMLFLLFPLYFYGFYGGNVNGGYVILLFPVWITYVFSFAGALPGRAFGYIVGFLAVLYTAELHGPDFGETRPVYIGMYGKAAAAILRSQSGPDTPFWIVSVDPHLKMFESWHTSSLWYALERASGRRYVKIIPWGPNFSAKEKRPETVYAICDRRVIWQVGEHGTCADLIGNAQGTYRLEFREIYAEHPISVYLAPVTAAARLPAVY